MIKSHTEKSRSIPQGHTQTHKDAHQDLHPNQILSKNLKRHWSHVVHKVLLESPLNSSLYHTKSKEARVVFLEHDTPSEPYSQT